MIRYTIKISLWFFALMFFNVHYEPLLAEQSNATDANIILINEPCIDVDRTASEIMKPLALELSRHTINSCKRWSAISELNSLKHCTEITTMELKNTWVATLASISMMLTVGCSSKPKVSDIVEKNFEQIQETLEESEDCDEDEFYNVFTRDCEDKP